MKLQLLSLPLLLASAAVAADIFTKDDARRVRVTPIPVPDKFVNEWSAEWEEAFWDRANDAIRARGKGGGYGNTYFENEKSSYPMAMFGYLAGFPEPALKFLQGEDDNAGGWNKTTRGIDFFPCFTLKGQMRKYFQFGPVLDPAYRERMKDGARIWTEKDPLRRPNTVWKPENNGKGWGPGAMNSWVDVRHTDNLQAMREAAVYLMAEETGNEETRQKYAERIRTFVVNMYRVGMGEWDSENYLGHTFCGYLNLYDFAKDDGVRALAKAGLDYMATSMAVKYCWGSACGPTKRDYNHPHRFGGSLADNMAIYAGNYGTEPRTRFEVDNAHLILSRYRPPAAVVALARKKAGLAPFELFAVHCHYDSLRKSADEPEEYETTYFGGSFQLGTLDRGTGRGDVNGFKAVVRDEKAGSRFFLMNCTESPKNLGSPQYGNSQVGSMNVAQYRSTAIVLNGKGDAPFTFMVAPEAKIEAKDGIAFVDYGKTWIALRPLGVSLPEEAPELSQKVKDAEGRFLAAKGAGKGPCGFVVEIGDEASHKSFAEFRRKVAAAKIDASALASGGTVAYTDSLDRSLKMTYGPRPQVWRDGVERPFAQSAPLWRDSSGDPSKGPVDLGWKEGTLRVTAGGRTFTCTVLEDGTVK